MWVRRGYDVGTTWRTHMIDPPSAPESPPGWQGLLYPRCYAADVQETPRNGKVDAHGGGSTKESRPPRSGFKEPLPRADRCAYRHRLGCPNANGSVIRTGRDGRPDRAALGALNTGRRRSGRSVLGQPNVGRPGLGRAALGGPNVQCWAALQRAVRFASPPPPGPPDPTLAPCNYCSVQPLTGVDHCGHTG